MGLMQENIEKAIGETFARMVNDSMTLNVETRVISPEVLNSDRGMIWENSKPVAVTTMRLDGDSSAVIPMAREDDNTLHVDQPMFEAHSRNVQIAIEYRVQMIKAIGALVMPGAKIGGE